MSRNPNGIASRIVTTVVGLTLLAGSAFASQPGADSPQALVERVKQAAEAKNLAEIANCLDPKSRTEMTQGLYMAATMVVAFSQMGLEMGAGMGEALAEDASAEDKAAHQAQLAEGRQEVDELRLRYNALVGKYGLPTIPDEGEAEPAELPEAELETLFAQIDQGAFLTDTMAFIESMPGTEEKPADESPIKIGAGVLADLVTDGDTATAMLDGEPVRFLRVDGRWYIDGSYQPESEAEPEAVAE